MLSILCPCYNEEKSIALLYQRIVSVMEKTDEKFQIVFVDDGSRDKTLSMLKDIAAKDSRVEVIEFSRNFGREAALTALLDYAKGDAAVIIDADLQQPPEIIPSMIEKWREGFDVVYAKRTDRSAETVFRGLCTRIFYKIYNAISHPSITEGVAEFCLMNRNAINAVGKLRETHRFMRGIFSWAGFRTAIVDYVCAERDEGESKFRFTKLVRLAFEGILAFSSFPLYMIIYLGSVLSLLILCYGVFSLFTNSGSISTFLILFLSSLNMFCSGILGLYVGRIYSDTKNRPIYIVREIYSLNKEHEKTDN